MKRRCRETGACLDREKLGLFYFFKFSINPEIADISQPKPIIINAIFHPIPLSKTKINGGCKIKCVSLRRESSKLTHFVSFTECDKITGKD